MAAFEQLVVQVFDGDNGGFYQFEKETNVLREDAAGACGRTHRASTPRARAALELASRRTR